MRLVTDPIACANDLGLRVFDEHSWATLVYTALPTRARKYRSKAAAFIRGEAFKDGLFVFKLDKGSV